MSKPIETVAIRPTKNMPLEIFRACWRQAYFLELMERLSDGRVLWDKNVTSIIAIEGADIEYYLLQNGFFELVFELPKKWAEKNLIRKPAK